MQAQPIEKHVGPGRCGGGGGELVIPNEDLGKKWSREDAGLEQSDRRSKVKCPSVRKVELVRTR